MQGVRTPLVTLTCEGCGNQFQRRQAEVDAGRYRFCSRPCAHSHRGPGSSHWKGGKRISQFGYVVLRIDGRYQFEHRIVAERMLGRPLARGEAVHHANGVKTDNRPENLIVMHQRDHAKLHQSDPNWSGPVRQAARTSSPAKSEAMRRRWADPEQRAAMQQAILIGKGLLPDGR